MNSKQMRVLVSGVVVLGWWVNSHGAFAQCDPIETQKLLASDGLPGDFVGVSVSISGDAAIAGAVGDDDQGVNSGSAYIFEQAGNVWAQTAKLMASDGVANDYFGQSVGISGHVAIVGAYRNDDLGPDSGSAYVFEKVAGVWTEVAKFTPADGAADDWFGYSVAASGSTAFVGARYDDDRGANSGSVYVFEKVGGVWGQVAKLTASDGAAGDHFGVTVSLAADRAIVGAVGDGSFSGSAYVFDKVGGAWTQSAKLTAADGAADDWFGISVSLRGDVAVVGAYYDDDRGADSGSAYVFEKSGAVWTQAAKLTASDGTAADYFGTSAAVSGDIVVVGAFGDGDRGAISGSVYVFKKVGGAWTQAAKILASDGAAGDWFGISASLYGDIAFIGARYDDDLGPDSGSAYVFDLNCGPTLRMVGPCPGRIRFIVEGATANGRVAYIYARGLGGLHVPNGNPCAGTQLGLNATAQLGGIAVADGSGVATLETNVPPGACGHVFVQSLDLESCSTSNVVPVN